MTCVLDADPLQYGPKRLNGKVAECRGHLSRCERIFLDLAQHLHKLRREHLRTTEDYDLQFKDLLANDPETRGGRNVADRDATASYKLRALKEKINALALTIQDLETVITIVKAKRVDLKDIQNRIKDQFKICQEEIGLGGRWSTRTSLPPTGNAPVQASAQAPEDASMDSLVEDALGLIGKPGGAFDNVGIKPSHLIEELSSHQFPTKVQPVEQPMETVGEVTVETVHEPKVPDIDSLLEGIVEDTGETSQQLASAVSINDLFG